MLRIVRLLTFWMAGWCLLFGTAAAATGSLAGGAAFQHAISSAFGGGMALAEDAQGFIWLGTQAGLVRWDGYLERAYLADPARADALPDSYVSTLHVDAAGRLWVGTNAGGLARYDPRTDSFERVADPQGLVGSEAAAFADRSPGSLWVGGSRGLAWLDLSTMTLQAVPLPATVGRVKALWAGRGGALWVAGEGGLWRRAAADSAFVPIGLPTRDGRRPRAARLLEDSQGNLWVGTRLRGAYVVRPGATVGTPVHEKQHGDLSSDTVQGLVEAQPGEVWIGTYGNGIVRVDLAGHRSQRERHDATQPSSLVDDSVGALLRSRSGLVWVATNYALSRHDPRQDLTDALYGGPGKPVRSNNVPAVLGLRDGRIWLATGESGAQILDPALGRVTELRPNAARPETALPKARVIALAQVPGDEVWIGTQGGLFRARPDGDGLSRVHLPDVPPTTEIWALYVQDGTLWMGGQDGLWALDLSQPPGSPRVRRIAVPGGTRVTALTATSGVLWVGTNDGLGRLNEAAARVDMLPSDPRDPSALPGGMVSSLAVDRQGRLWVATFGRGVQVASGTNARGAMAFRRLSTLDGLPHNGVDALVVDREGLVWASTDDGLARVDPATLDVRAFRAGQNVGLTLFWTGAGSTLPGGELLFGGQGGLLVVHPERVRAEPAPPPPVITEASVGGRAVPAARLMDGAGVVLPADAPSLTVEFASLAFTDRDQLRYAYQLEGFDSDWVAAPPQRRLASYTNLAAGRYTLKLRVARPRDGWSAPLTLAVQVQSHWYQHPVAQVVAGLLAIGLLLGVERVRMLVMRRRQARLEALVARRTAELERRTSELHASRAQLEQMAFFDGMTGLPNRRWFADDLRRTVAEVQRGGEGFAVALVDLDRFKEVNDRFGHDAGDAVLVEVARRLREALRAGDRAARLGGDEFVAVLRPIGDDLDALAAVCGRIVEALAQPIALPDGQKASLGCSVGVARCPLDATDVDRLLKAADLAMYEAKAAGRGQWRLWQAAREAAVLDPAP
ncbi:diguanylate cyclase domain-containing protein [Aquabacterium sp.]|uniref:diguanylate cyclase domain-containing protein n=1 Tax=Aquabacterium sp. TaxID=1872578 RepID=UPI00378455F7